MSQPEFDQKSAMRWLWFSLFFFGFGLLVLPDWGAEETRSGAIASLVLIVILYIAVLLRWRKRLSKDELAKARSGYHKISTGNAYWYLLFVVVAIYQLFIRAVPSNRQQYIVALLSVLAFGMIPLALMIAYRRKGLFQ